MFFRTLAPWWRWLKFSLVAGALALVFGCSSRPETLPEPDIIEQSPEMVDEVPVPVGTRDFSPILLRIQQEKPDVVAAAVGGDDFKVLRQQVNDMGLASSPAWINNQPIDITIEPEQITSRDQLRWNTRDS